MASAPVKAVDQKGESPFQANVTSLKTESNCVLARGGGEQLEVNDQSVTFRELNSAKPVGEPAGAVRTLDRATVVP